MTAPTAFTRRTGRIERRSLHQKRTSQSDCDHEFKRQKLDPIQGSSQNSSSAVMSDEEVLLLPSDECPAEASDSEVSEFIGCTLFFLHEGLTFGMIAI